MTRTLLRSPSAIVAALATATSLLAGCASAPPRSSAEQAPAAVAAAPFRQDRPAVALVLSGGGMRGYAHIGVLKVLEEEGIRADLVVGTSAGSLVGALYASGLSPAQVEEALGSIEPRTLSDLVLPGLGFLRGEMGLLRGEKLHRFVDERLRTPLIQDFPIRFAAVATDLVHGTPVAFNQGDAGIAVLASSAVPGLVAPVIIDGRRYVDGGVASPLPVTPARGLGGRVVIAVDVGYPPEHSVLSNPVSVLFQAYIIASQRLTAEELQRADVVIAPDFPRTTQFGLSERPMLVAIGEKAARDALPRIRAAIAGLSAH